MILRLFLGLLVFITLSGCELLPSLLDSQPELSNRNNQSICVWKDSSDKNNCNIDYWLRYWSSVEDIDWPERKKLITSLTTNDSDVLKKIFLSQSKSTPYQNRLRAQTWIESLLPKLSEDMRRFLVVSIYHPSQDLLEMESALVTLSKINTYQSENLEEHKALLKKQKGQLEQLLNIEANIIQSTEEAKK
jgi:hypothetical protein